MAAMFAAVSTEEEASESQRFLIIFGRFSMILEYFGWFWVEMEAEVPGRDRRGLGSVEFQGLKALALCRHGCGTARGSMACRLARPSGVGAGARAGFEALYMYIEARETLGS